jgi:hypothetical protein
MGDFLLELIAGGHLVALVLMLTLVFALLYQYKVTKVNGLTWALALYVAATAFEKSWSVARIWLEPLIGSTGTLLTDQTLLQNWILFWRVVTVWLVVGMILWLIFTLYVRQNRD